MHRSLEDNTARALLEANDHRKNGDGRGVWIQVKRFGDGNDNSEEQIREYQDKLNATKYQGIGSNNTKTTTTRLI